MFVVGTELRNAVRGVLSGKNIDCAVAFWGKGACKRLKLPPDLSTARIACDAYSGACNPAAIEELLARNASVVDVPKLHAKVYIGDTAMVVSSSNASANGLGNEDVEVDETLEAGYLAELGTSESARARVWFNAIFHRGRPLSISDLPGIRDAWKSARQGRPYRTGHSLIDLLINNPASLTAKGLRVAFYKEEDTPDVVERAFKDSPYFDPAKYNESDVPFYWGTSNWTVEPGDLILDLSIDNGRINVGGCWRVLGWVKDDILALSEVPNALGLSWSSKDRSQLKKLISTAYAAGRLRPANSLFDPLGFAKKLKPA